jgi:hypothetical protein
MPFDYELRFAGHRTVAHNLSLGPVEDLSVVVYDRSDRAALQIDFDANPALYDHNRVGDYRRRFLTVMAA